MTINNGAITDVIKGTQAFDKVYHGDTLVFERYVPTGTVIIDYTTCPTGFSATKAYKRTTSVGANTPNAGKGGPLEIQKATSIVLPESVDKLRLKTGLMLYTTYAFGLADYVPENQSWYLLSSGVPALSSTKISVTSPTQMPLNELKNGVPYLTATSGSRTTTLSVKLIGDDTLEFDSSTADGTKFANSDNTNYFALIDKIVAY